MKKAEYMETHGLTLRAVTPEDVAAAKTDYQRAAGYVISDESGAEWYSMNGSQKDMENFMKWKKEKGAEKA